MEPAVHERVNRLSVTVRVFGGDCFEKSNPLLGLARVYREWLSDNRILLTAMPEHEVWPSDLGSYNRGDFVATPPARDKFLESGP
jgi:hypothetical protein